jgi:ribosomal protein L21E
MQLARTHIARSGVVMRAPNGWRDTGSMREWTEGDRVRVSIGIFEGFSGTVVGHEGDDVEVLVEIFERVTPVLLRPGDLEPGDEGSGGSGGVRKPRRPVGPSSGEQSAAVLGS